MRIRRVAVFHNAARVGSAWSCAEGIFTSLTKKGLEVINCGHPLANDVSIDVLRGMDLIILGAPEWFFEVLLD